MPISHQRSIAYTELSLGEHSKTIVHALIISKLDHCNSLYVNLPDKLLDKLQSVLHDAFLHGWLRVLHDLTI